MDNSIRLSGLQQTRLGKEWINFNFSHTKTKVDSWINDVWVNSNSFKVRYVQRDLVQEAQNQIVTDQTIYKDQTW